MCELLVPQEEPPVRDLSTLTVYEQIRKLGYVPEGWGKPSLKQAALLDERGLAPAEPRTSMEGGIPAHGV